MDVFKMVCNEIDDLERDFTSTIKTTGKDIIKAYKEMVEDDSYTDFTDELSKFYNKNRQRLRGTCQNMFKTEDLMNSKQQYLQEVETIHKKAREMAKLFRVKTRSDKSENRPAAPQTKSNQQKIMIPRGKLQEIDINTLANNMHKKTHLQIQNRAALKIQAAFRFYLKNKAKKGIKKNHVPAGKAKNNTKAIINPRLSNRATTKENKIDVKKVIKIQRAFREYIIRKKLLKIRNGLLKLKKLIIEKRIRSAFQQISTSKQSKAKILKRVNEVLRIKKMRNIVTAKMNYQKLRMISKSDGKYKMAENYSLSYRQIQVFYAWLLITGGVELK